MSDLLRRAAAVRIAVLVMLIAGALTSRLQAQQGRMLGTIDAVEGTVAVIDVDGQKQRVDLSLGRLFRADAIAVNDLEPGAFLFLAQTDAAGAPAAVIALAAGVRPERGYVRLVKSDPQRMSLQVTSPEGDERTVRYSRETRFSQDVPVTADAFQPGARVAFRVQANGSSHMRIIAADPSVSAHFSKTDLARGAPYRVHTLEPSDYFAFHVRWWLLALVVVAAWLVGRFIHTRARGRWWGGISAAVVPLLLVAGVTEYFVIAVEPFGDRFVTHPRLIWALAPHLPGPGAVPMTDESGLRPVHPHDDPQTVLVVGDSSTFGIKVASDSIYTWRLAEDLGRLHGGATPRVMNCGVPGYSSWQGLKVLKERLRTETPNLVEVSFMANDWTWGEVPDEALDLDGLAGDVRALLRRSSLYLATRNAVLRHTRAADPNIPANYATFTHGQRVPPDHFEQNLDEMRKACEARAIPILFVILPLDASLESVSRPYREAVARVGARPGAHLLDLYAAWQRQALHPFPADDPIHPDSDGHRFIAEAVAHCIIDQKLLWH